MKPITIRIAAPGEPYAGSFIVEQDGRMAMGLAWDEMLGQIAALTIDQMILRMTRHGRGSDQAGIYDMETPEEISAKAERHAEIHAERNANPPTNDDEPDF